MAKQKCDGDYPEWEFNKEFINDDRTPIAPESCAGCEYIYACQMRVSLLINLGIEVSDQQLEEIRILAKEEKNNKHQIH